MDKILSTAQLIDLLDDYKFTRAIKQLHVHHTYDPDHADFCRRADGLYWNNVMRTYHMTTKGWQDIAQQLTLLPNGQWVTGRSWDLAPASILGWNDGAFAIEMLGNFDRDNFGSPQSSAMFELCAAFCRILHLDIDKDIKFHRDSPSTSKTCPGKLIDKEAFIKSVKEWSGSVAAAIKTLQDAGVIGSPDYWTQNAVKGKTVAGENAAALIIKMAKKIERGVL